MSIRRDARVSHSAKKDRVKVAPKYLHGIRGKCRAVAQEPFGAPVELRNLKLPFESSDARSENPYRFTCYFNSDAVAGYNCDALNNSLSGIQSV
jgi:hypothetical protein